MSLSENKNEKKHIFFSIGWQGVASCYSTLFATHHRVKEENKKILLKLREFHFHIFAFSLSLSWGLIYNKLFRLHS